MPHHPRKSRSVAREPGSNELADRAGECFICGVMIKAVIFDCDGVLFDSERANTEYFNDVLAAAGQAPLDAEGERLARALAGPQLLDALFGGDRALVERVAAAGRALDYTPYFQWMDPVPGLFETLALLRASYRLGMATNRGTTVPLVMQRFELTPFIEVAVGVLDVPRPKPFPDMLEKCLQHFQIAASEAVYVGDSPTDYEAADAAGMHFVGVGERTGASIAIAKLDELAASIARL